jgi:aminopeptidase N
MTKLVTQFFNYLGFEESPSDPHLTILSRSDAMNWACRLGVPECTQKATLQYAAWMSSSADVE